MKKIRDIINVRLNEPKMSAKEKIEEIKRLEKLMAELARNANTAIYNYENNIKQEVEKKPDLLVEEIPKYDPERVKIVEEVPK
jgi:hypothetical protein